MHSKPTPCRAAFRLVLNLAFIFLFTHASHAGDIAGNATAPDLQQLTDSHPRLLVDEADFRKLAGRQWDALGAEYWRFLQQTGEDMLELEPVSYNFTGRRLLQESRKALKRIVTWSLLYRVDGDTRFRDRAIREMEAAAALPDWNPAHYLDVGEMALALAIGADWLWDDLSESQRTRFLAALKTKGILPSLDESDPDNWWIYYDNNWNPVCHSGLVASALMLADSEPELAERVIERALRALPFAMEAYEPEGAYPEGPVYWDYGTAFTAVFLDLLDNSFGSTFGLDDQPGFRRSATYRAAAITPTGKFYNYADCGEEGPFATATAWFASQYGDPAARHEMKRGLRSYLNAAEWDPADGNGRMLPFVALWYPDFHDNGPDKSPDLPNLWLGKGPNPVAFVRESWGDPESLFLGFKGNDGSVSHAHLDAGSFIFEDAGVRWAIDLGHQNYTSIEEHGLGIWDRRQHADRWRVFRLGPYSHNVLLIDQRPQGAETKADITRLESKDGLVHGTVDLTPVYEGQAARYQRHFRIHDNKVLQVTDIIEGARERTERQGRSPATLRWRMLTRADVTIEGNTAILRQEGRTLRLQVRQPEAFTLRAGPIDPPPYFWDQPNPGVTAIDVWTKADNDGNQTIDVIMGTDGDQDLL